MNYTGKNVCILTRTLSGQLTLLEELTDLDNFIRDCKNAIIIPFHLTTHYNCSIAAVCDTVRSLQQTLGQILS